MEVLAMFLMVFPVVGLALSGIILVLIMGIGSYSLVEWWLGRRAAIGEASAAELGEKLPT